MSRWEIRRTGRRRWEVVPAGGLLDRLLIGVAVATVAAGAASVLLPAVAGWAVAHAGTVALGLLVAMGVAVVLRGR